VGVSKRRKTTTKRKREIGTERGEGRCRVVKENERDREDQHNRRTQKVERFFWAKFFVCET